MSKLHASITNESGTTVSKGGNEELKIDLKIGNKRLGWVILSRCKHTDIITLFYHPYSEGERQLLHDNNITCKETKHCLNKSVKNGYCPLHQHLNTTSTKQQDKNDICSDCGGKAHDNYDDCINH